MATLIRLCHGTLLDEFPMRSADDTSLITIVLADQPVERARLAHGVHSLSPEWVLESLVQFALQPFEAYEEQF